MTRAWRRNILWYLLAGLLLALLLAGCGGREPSGSETPPGPEPSPEDEPWAEVTAERSALLDKLSLDLPEGVTRGEFDLYILDLGGAPLLDETGTVCGGIALMRGTAGIYDQAGTLTGMTPFSNHSSLDDFSPVPGDVPCVTARYSYDIFDDEAGTYTGTGARWYAFWTVDGLEPVYAVYLEADWFDRGVLLEVAQSAVFQEGAFLPRVS